MSIVRFSVQIVMTQIVSVNANLPVLRENALIL